MMSDSLPQDGSSPDVDAFISDVMRRESDERERQADFDRHHGEVHAQCMVQSVDALTNSGYLFEGIDMDRLFDHEAYWLYRNELEQQGGQEELVTVGLMGDIAQQRALMDNQFEETHEGLRREFVVQCMGVLHDEGDTAVEQFEAALKAGFEVLGTPQVFAGLDIGSVEFVERLKMLVAVESLRADSEDLLLERRSVFRRKLSETIRGHGVRDQDSDMILSLQARVMLAGSIIAGAPYEERDQRITEKVNELASLDDREIPIEELREWLEEAVAVEDLGN